MEIKTVGSVCSGIEAASVAWNPLGLEMKWLAEIATFPAKFLAERYPDVPNLGDMTKIPMRLSTGEIEAPDMICGGTPCQAFSMSGNRGGLNDPRGNLALGFVNIIEENDRVRMAQGKRRGIVFWENVVGVLSDETNALGCMLTALSGIDVMENTHWSPAGIIHGTKRNVAWRVLDAKYFGVAQQRKRIFLMAGDTDFYPEHVLFEEGFRGKPPVWPGVLEFEKEGHKFKLFRDYTDCLLAGYGSKYSGNSSGYTGKMFIMQDGYLRRLTALECERLQGFPDGYTDIEGATYVARCAALGNSWAIPVIRWLGERLLGYDGRRNSMPEGTVFCAGDVRQVCIDGTYYNCSDTPLDCKLVTLRDVVTSDAPDFLYLKPHSLDSALARKNRRGKGVTPFEVLYKAGGCFRCEAVADVGVEGAAVIENAGTAVIENAGTAVIENAGTAVIENAGTGATEGQTGVSDYQTSATIAI